MRSPSANPFALATAQLPVAITLAPALATALAPPASQVFKRTTASPGVQCPELLSPCTA